MLRQAAAKAAEEGSISQRAMHEYFMSGKRIVFYFIQYSSDLCVSLLQHFSKSRSQSYKYAQNEKYKKTEP